VTADKLRVLGGQPDEHDPKGALMFFVGTPGLEGHPPRVAHTFSVPLADATPESVQAEANLYIEAMRKAETIVRALHPTLTLVH